MIDFLTENSGVLGLLFFFSAFSVIAFTALRPSVKERVESHRFIPLEEDK